MLTKDDRLAMLDAEFDSPINRATGRMRVEEYLAKRSEIEAMPAPAAPAPALPAPSGLTQKQVSILCRAIGTAIREHVKEKLEPLEARLSSLADAGRVAEVQARVAALEKKQLSYCGVFSEGEQYDHGNIVTHAGQLWYCRELTRDKPGTAAWKLMHKRGADGEGVFR